MSYMSGPFRQKQPLKYRLCHFHFPNHTTINQITKVFLFKNEVFYVLHIYCFSNKITSICKWRSFIPFLDARSCLSYNKQQNALTNIKTCSTNHNLFRSNMIDRCQNNYSLRYIICFFKNGENRWSSCWYRVLVHK